MNKIMELCEDKPDDKDALEKLYGKLHGRCAVASVKYLLGDIREAKILAEANWRRVEEQEIKVLSEAKLTGCDAQYAGDYTILKWMASYAYFQTRSIGSGELEEALKQMTEHWERGYIFLPQREQNCLIKKADNLAVNPILARPRTVMLATAFAGSAIDATFDDFSSELDWVNYWDAEAKKACRKASSVGVDCVVSQAFNHFSIAFYLTLLSLDERCTADMRDKLQQNADAAIGNIENGSVADKPVAISDYIQQGFYGIYTLAINGEPEKALQAFHKAAQHSDFSGNRFGIVDYLFMCCRAVAAQKAGPHLQLEADRYLKETERVATTVGSRFYFDLYNAAHAEIESLRGNSGLAARIDAALRAGPVKECVIRLFRTDFQKHN